MKQIRIRYFAALRDQAGRSEETRATDAATPAALYAELAGAHGLTLPLDLLRVAVNDRFADMHGPLRDGDLVAFIPPVAGG